uniref:HTH arsR-type domain-containing protein n=1 Tax=mine drainage metagenome TaxID=410659 RepID=E6QHM4_9ZZZZ
MLGKGKDNEVHQARDFACRRMSNFFTIFAHATRMRIFCALENGPQTVTRIADEAGISTSNASQNLRLMRDRGAVVTERQGQSVYYRMADRRFMQAANIVCEALNDLSNNNDTPHIQQWRRGGPPQTLTTESCKLDPKQDFCTTHKDGHPGPDHQEPIWLPAEQKTEEKR